MLSQLIKAEMAEREVRSIAYQTKVAGFPSYKDLAGFDFKSSEINEATAGLHSLTRDFSIKHACWAFSSATFHRRFFCGPEPA